MEESLLDSATDAYSNDVGVNGSTRWQRRQHRRNRNGNNTDDSRTRNKKQYGSNSNDRRSGEKNSMNNPKQRRSQSQAHSNKQGKAHSRSQSVFSDTQYFSDRFIPLRDESNDGKSDKTQLFNMVNGRQQDAEQREFNENKNDSNIDENEDNDRNGDGSSNSNNNNNSNNNSNNDSNSNHNSSSKNNNGSKTPEKEFDSRLKASLLNRDGHRADGGNGSGVGIDGDSVEVNSRILSFCNKAPLPSQEFNANMQALYSVGMATANNCKNNFGVGGGNNQYRKKKVRFVAQSADRILDAPEFQDNFYLNLLDWSSKNVIAIGLASKLFLWNADGGTTVELFDYTNQDKYVTSVAWTHSGSHIAVGMDDGIVYIWDTQTCKQIRKMRGHSLRVGSLSWNTHMLTSGSEDTLIMNHDVRTQNHHISTFKGHEQEICGLKWDNNVDGKYLASGGNDNVVNVWKNEHISRGGHSSNGTPMIDPYISLTECKSAVKAMAWCPWQYGLLATGGGTGDRKIRFYDINRMNHMLESGNNNNNEEVEDVNCLMKEIDTQSQVCSLVWNPFAKEILSSHGFSKFQLSIWRYPSLVKTHDLTGHSSRVLHTALNPDGTMVCSAAADETLRLWKVFEEPPPSTRTKNIDNFSNKPSKLNMPFR